MSAPDRVTLYPTYYCDMDGCYTEVWQEEYPDDDPLDGGVEYIRADLVPQWQTIETCPEEELVQVFGRHKTGEAWFNMGSLWGDEWDGPWIAELTPTHWMTLPEPTK